MIFLRDISIPPAFSSRCSVVSLAKTTVQGFSGCNEAKSSMHSGEESGDELTHLDEEEVNSNLMNRGGFRLSAQRSYSNRDVAPAPLPAPARPTLPPTCQLPKKKEKKENNCIASTFGTVSIFVQKHGESSPVHVTDVRYFFIKVCQFMAWDFS